MQKEILRCVMTAIACLQSGAGAFANENAGRYLFFDPGLAEVRADVSIVVNPPTSREVVLRRDRPWEHFVTFYLTVIDEGEKIRMWYDSRDAEGFGRVAYAESIDGVHWKKPELGLVDYKGSKANNLVGIPQFEGNVFRDPNPPSPDRRYLYITNIHKGGGVFCYRSPDGLSWKRDAAPLIGFDCDSQNVTLWDAALGRYVLFLRGWDAGKKGGKGRMVARLETERLDRPLDVPPKEYEKRVPREMERSPFLREELPTVFARDDDDPAVTDVYTNAMQLYPVDPRWYIGFPAMYHHARPAAHPASKISDGRTEIRFIASRDGKTWEQFDRSAYIAPGLKDSDSANMIYIGSGMIVRGNELLHYGTAYRGSHGDAPFRAEHGDGVVYLYRQRIDGFVSLDFGVRDGRCTTRPLVIEGERLLLNVDTGALGSLKVGILDEKGDPVPGFGTDDCTPIQANDLSAPASWKGGSLGPLKGKNVRLEFVGTRTKLYSFRFESP